MLLEKCRRCPSYGSADTNASMCRVWALLSLPTFTLMAAHCQSSSTRISLAKIENLALRMSQCLLFISFLVGTLRIRPGALDRGRFACKVGAGIVPGEAPGREHCAEEPLYSSTALLLFGIGELMQSRLARERKIKARLLLGFLLYLNE